MLKMIMSDIDIIARNCGFIFESPSSKGVKIYFIKNVMRDANAKLVGIDVY